MSDPSNATPFVRPARGSRPPHVARSSGTAPPGHTLCRDRDAEARVTQDLARLSAAVDADLGGSLVALLLLGSYARGEGSVVEHRGELSASSCYELLVVVRGDKSDSARFEAISATWSDRLGVDVHVTARTRRELRSAGPALTWVDVAGGLFEVLAGDASIGDQLRSLHPQDLPAEAWAATLCDAALGIALDNVDALGRAKHGARTLHEAVLAAGDALLLSASCYAFDAEERARELERIERDHGHEGLASAYEDALRYLARPDRWQPSESGAAGELSPVEAFRRARTALVAQVHFTIEAKRLGSACDPLGYALFRERLWSDTSYLGLRGLRASLRAARTGIPQRHARGDLRERLARVAVLLAYGTERLEARHLAARLLGVRSNDDTTADDVELYVRLCQLRRHVLHTRSGGDPLAGARYGRS